LNEIIGILNQAMTRLFEVMMVPVASWPLVALIVCSAITGIVMAVVFRFTSNQKAIGRAADGSRAELLAINLFQDDLGGVFRSLGRLFRHVFARIGHSLPPVVVIIIPLVLLFSQLASWYEWRPLVAEQPVVVELEIASNHWKEGQNAQLKSFDGTVEAGPMRDVGKFTVFWRLRPAASKSGIGVDQLQFDVAGEIVEKRLAVSSTGRDFIPVGPYRSVNLLTQILYPIEPGLSQTGPVKGIVIHYPGRETLIFGWNIPWWLTFLVVSMVAAIAVKPLVGVKF
jgi:hypothetical protein